MKNGDKIACKMVLAVGMHQILLASKTLQCDNIEQLEIKDNLAKVNPKLTDIVGNDPDEIKLLSNDEIGGLSSGDILLTTLGNDRQTIHSADLLDLASDTSFNSEQQESSDNNINPDNFYTKEAMPSSSTENTPCSMSVTCTMEKSEENENIEETKSLNSNPHDQELKQNTHIFYQGRWYHINQFIAWEQISSLPGSKGNFICQSKQDLTVFTVTVAFDKFITTKSNTPSAVSQNTYIAAWNYGKYTFGNIKRLIRLSVRGKSAYPLFYWDKTLRTQDVEMAIQLMLPIENKKKRFVPYLPVVKDIHMDYSKRICD